MFTMQTVGRQLLEGLKNVICLICVLSPAALPSTATAAKGVVVYYKAGCDYYVVETPRGFALLEWYGGNDPDEGDELVGDFETYGMKEIYNLTAEEQTRVWVEDYYLSSDQVMEQYFDQCN